MDILVAHHTSTLALACSDFGFVGLLRWSLLAWRSGVGGRDGEVSGGTRGLGHSADLEDALGDRTGSRTVEASR